MKKDAGDEQIIKQSRDFYRLSDQTHDAHQ